MTIIEFSQFSQFIFFLLAGILASLILVTSHQLLGFIFNRKYIFLVLDIIVLLLFTAYYIYLVNIVFYGEIRIYSLLAFILGITIELITFRKLFGFLLKRGYNIFRNLKEKFKDNRFFKFISK